MPSITFIHPDERRQTLDARDGAHVMQIAVGSGIAEIVGECGGNAMCATCHVYVDDAWTGRLPAISDDEDALLDGTATERLPNSRLSCQITMTPELDGLVLRLPDKQV